MNLRRVAGLCAVFGTPAVSLQAGCGSGRSGGLAGEVGTYEPGDAGSFTFASGDGTTAAKLSVSVSPPELTSCAGECLTLTPQGVGGTPPYSYTWSDGLATDGGSVTVCPTVTTTYSVTATDSSGHSGELSRPDNAATRGATITVLDCTDGGIPRVDAACDADGGADAVKTGHYAGTVTCGPGSHFYNGAMDGGNVIPDGGGGTVGSLSLDFAIDGTQTQQTGTWYFQWSLQLVAAGGSLQGSLDCGTGELRAIFVNSTWGLPGGSAMTVIPAGTIQGIVTAKPVLGTPGAIAGVFEWQSDLLGNSSLGSACLGSYSAQLQP
jgi:hypothetical protein